MIIHTHIFQKLLWFFIAVFVFNHNTEVIEYAIEHSIEIAECDENTSPIFSESTTPFNTNPDNNKNNTETDNRILAEEKIEEVSEYHPLVSKPYLKKTSSSSSLESLYRKRYDYQFFSELNPPPPKA